ncbi:MAG TPA: outer membrane lipoprotein-sorting protein, partial [Treponemataceae bacterium]|nr:outer membrane lipoprotein-sorting protein [Treponemataceae bacterium]
DITKTITLFLSPARVKNTRFLSISEKNGPQDQWIFLPALQKVKRISAGEQEGSFMGSDLSYSDMSTFGIKENADHTILTEEVFQNKNCYVVQSRTKKGEDSSYGKIITWVDKETWLTPRIEFYNKKGTDIVKIMVCENFSQEQGHWFAKKISMKTVAENHTTELDFLQVKYDVELPSGYFTTSFLQTGRVR